MSSQHAFEPSSDPLQSSLDGQGGTDCQGVILPSPVVSEPLVAATLKLLPLASERNVEIFRELLVIIAGLTTSRPPAGQTDLAILPELTVFATLAAALGAKGQELEESLSCSGMPAGLVEATHFLRQQGTELAVPDPLYANLPVALLYTARLLADCRLQPKLSSGGGKREEWEGAWRKIIRRGFEFYQSLQKREGGRKLALIEGPLTQLIHRIDELVATFGEKHGHPSKQLLLRWRTLVGNEVNDLNAAKVDPLVYCFNENSSSTTLPTGTRNINSLVDRYYGLFQQLDASLGASIRESGTKRLALCTALVNLANWLSSPAYAIASGAEPPQVPDRPLKVERGSLAYSNTSNQVDNIASSAEKARQNLRSYHDASYKLWLLREYLPFSLVYEGLEELRICITRSREGEQAGDGLSQGVIDLLFDMLRYHTDSVWPKRGPKPRPILDKDYEQFCSTLEGRVNPLLDVAPSPGEAVAKARDSADSWVIYQLSAIITEIAAYSHFLKSDHALGAYCLQRQGARGSDIPSAYIRQIRKTITSQDCDSKPLQYVSWSALQRYSPDEKFNNKSEPGGSVSGQADFWEVYRGLSYLLPVLTRHLISAISSNATPLLSDEDRRAWQFDRCSFYRVSCSTQGEKFVANLASFDVNPENNPWLLREIGEQWAVIYVLPDSGESYSFTDFESFAQALADSTNRIPALSFRLKTPASIWQKLGRCFSTLAQVVKEMSLVGGAVPKSPLPPLIDVLACSVLTNDSSDQVNVVAWMQALQKVVGSTSPNGWTFSLYPTHIHSPEARGSQTILVLNRGSDHAELSSSKESIPCELQLKPVQLWLEEVLGKGPHSHEQYEKRRGRPLLGWEEVVRRVIYGHMFAGRVPQ